MRFLSHSCSVLSAKENWLEVNCAKQRKTVLCVGHTMAKQVAEVIVGGVGVVMQKRRQRPVKQ
eukprot:SAG11_NODE_106_length_16423_cov_51.220840_18_plen_63_part_00